VVRLSGREVDGRHGPVPTVVREPSDAGDAAAPQDRNPAPDPDPDPNPNPDTS
jgi:hypothetical protein